MGMQSELIDSLKARLGLVSDYAVARRWQVEPTRISQYRRNRLRLPLRFVIDIADETGQDALILLRFLDAKRAAEKGGDAQKTNAWRPNENVRRYPPPWVSRHHYIRKTNK